MAPPRPPRTRVTIRIPVTVLLATTLAGTFSAPAAIRTRVPGDVPRRRRHFPRSPVVTILLLAHLLIERDVPRGVLSNTTGAIRESNARRLS
jgi:hypothetical protein